MLFSGPAPLRWYGLLFSVGIVGGFRTLFEGRDTDIHPLTIDEVSRLHTRGGSILRTSRDYPDNPEEKFRVMMSTIRRLGSIISWP